jgi:arginase
VSPAIVATGVPIDCINAVEPGSAPFGTELSPAVLRDAGLPDAIGAADGGDLAVRLVGQDRDPGTGVLGWPSVLATTQAVRSLAREQIAGGRLPFLVGGCCTLLPGALVSGHRGTAGRPGSARPARPAGPG